MRVKTYTLRIEQTNPGLLPDERPEGLEEMIQEAVQEAEENISDLLPEGFYCKIEED